ncbi:MAG TPA: uroporphyrinogen-III synthase [Nitrospira sp.]|nr:uroporphyrinogen-III synthase [Nitrospira sp.]
MADLETTEQLRSKSKQFAIGVLKFAGDLPKTAEIQTIETPLMKSATTLAVHCRRLARARSEDGLLDTRGRAADEADDCVFWLELLGAVRTDQEKAIQTLLEEAAELIALLSICFEPDQPASAAEPHAAGTSSEVSPPTVEEPTDFRGLRVLAFESRMAKEMTRLIERHGGVPHVVPAMREIPIPLQDNGAVFRFGVKLMLHQIDILILMTGVGTKALFEILQVRYPLAQLIEALKAIIVVTRGPKPLAALRVLGVESNLTVPEPNTWQDVIATLDYYRPVKGLRIAVQEYGASNAEMVQDLKSRGADVFPVPIYRWALPEDTGPLTRAIRDVLEGKIDVILVTNAAQIDHVLQLAEQEGQTAPFKEACKRLIVGSIGPTASERLKHHDLPVDFEPSHPKMGILVKELGEQVHALRQSKRSPQGSQ